jgi:hypothetical protein
MRLGRSVTGGSTDWPGVSFSWRGLEKFSWKVARTSGFFDRRFAGPLQYRPQRVADELGHGVIGNRQAIFLPQPWPHGFVTGTAGGLGQTVTEGALPGR